MGSTAAGKLCLGGCAMVVDVQSNIVTGPTAILNSMAKVYGGTFNSSYGQYTVVQFYLIMHVFMIIINIYLFFLFFFYKRFLVIKYHQCLISH